VVHQDLQGQLATLEQLDHQDHQDLQDQLVLLVAVSQLSTLKLAPLTHLLLVMLMIWLQQATLLQSRSQSHLQYSLQTTLSTCNKSALAK
jgi:hypothetical protein